MVDIFTLSAAPKVSLLKGDIVVAETYKRMKQEKMRAAQERQRRRQQEAQRKQKEKLQNFLEKHDFDPLDLLNVIFFMFGLSKTPLWDCVLSRCLKQISGPK